MCYNTNEKGATDRRLALQVFKQKRSLLSCEDYGRSFLLVLLCSLSSFLQKNKVGCLTATHFSQFKHPFEKRMASILQIEFSDTLFPLQNSVHFSFRCPLLFCVVSSIAVTSLSKKTLLFSRPYHTRTVRVGYLPAHEKIYRKSASRSA